MDELKRIAVFASGNGSNAQRIAEYFEGNREVAIEAVYCNNPGAFVLERAARLSIPSVLFTREAFRETGEVLHDLQQRKVEWIILAGFLWLIPPDITRAFEGRIINIHPALLPAFGGKGMYGENVHRAVIASGARESGITIHFVNEKYDDGQIIFQATCPVDKSDTPESLAHKVHELEYRYYPEIISDLLSGKRSGAAIR